MACTRLRRLEADEHKLNDLGCFETTLGLIYLQFFPSPEGEIILRIFVRSDIIPLLQILPLIGPWRRLRASRLVGCAQSLTTPERIPANFTPCSVQGSAWPEKGITKPKSRQGEGFASSCQNSGRPNGSKPSNTFTCNTLESGADSDSYTVLKAKSS